MAWELRDVGRRLLRSRLFWGGALSVLIQLQYQAVRLGSGIILARIMGPVQLGVYSFAMALVQLAQIIPAYGVDGVVIRYSSQYRAQDSWDLLRGLWRVALLGSVAYGLLSAVAMLGILSLGWLKTAGAFSPSVMAIAALLLLCMPILTYLGSVLRTVNPGVTGQLPTYTVQPWIFLALLLALVIAARHAVDARAAIFAQGISAALSIAVAMVWLRKHRPTRIRQVRPRFELGRWLSSASSFWLIGGLDLINTQADLIMLGVLGTAHETGIYRVAANGANLLGLSVAAVNLYIGPKIPEIHARGDFARLQRLLLLCARGAFAISLPVACVVWIWGRELLRGVFGAAYVSAFWPLAILTLGQLIIIGSGSAGLLLGMTGHERDVARLTGVAAMCNLALNAALIPRFGAIGSASATAISMLIWRVLLFSRAKARTRLNVSIFARGPYR